MVGYFGIFSKNDHIWQKPKISSRNMWDKKCKSHKTWKDPLPHGRLFWDFRKIGVLVWQNVHIFHTFLRFVYISSWYFLDFWLGNNVNKIDRLKLACIFSKRLVRVAGKSEKSEENRKVYAILFYRKRDVQKCAKKGIKKHKNMKRPFTLPEAILRYDENVYF